MFRASSVFELNLFISTCESVVHWIRSCALQFFIKFVDFIAIDRLGI